MSEHTIDDFHQGERVIIEHDPALGTVGQHGAIVRIVPGLHFPVHVQLDRAGLHIYEPFQLLHEHERPVAPPRTGKRRKRTS